MQQNKHNWSKEKQNLNKQTKNNFTITFSREKQ